MRALDDDQELSTELVRLRAHELEKIAHGNPSGIDDAVAAYACPVRYVRGGQPLPMADVASPRLWVGLTAERTSTMEAVAGVARLAEARPGWFRDLLATASDVVTSAEGALRQGDWPGLGLALTANHELLQAVEVSTAALDSLVAAALEAGAYGAKLTGGGLGGAAIAITPPEVDLGEVWTAAGATEVIAP